MTRRSLSRQFVFNLEPETKQLRMASTFFPTIKSMLRSQYDQLIRGILNYFHQSYISDDLLLAFLKVVQIWDSIGRFDVLDMALRRLSRDFENKYSNLWNHKYYWYDTTSIIERLYVLFVMLFRYKKLERYRKFSVPSVDEFVQEWEDMLQSARESGMELSDIVMGILEDVYVHEDLLSDFKRYTDYYKHKFGNLLPNARNKYEIRNRRDDRHTSTYESFINDRRPWLYRFSINELLYGATSELN